MRSRLVGLLLSVLFLIPSGAIASPILAEAQPADVTSPGCVSGGVELAAVSLFGEGTEFAGADTVAGLDTALVMEPYIAPGTRHRMIAVPGGWCDAERAFNQAWIANGRSFQAAGAMAEAYARLAAAPYFDQTTVTARRSISGVHQIETHALTNGVEAEWTIVTDASGVRSASWAQTGFAVEPFIAQWEGLTALPGASERYLRLQDGMLEAVRGLPKNQVDEPAAEVSYTGPDGFKIIVSIGDTRQAVDSGTDTGNSRADLLRDVRRAVAENYEDFYGWGFRADWARAVTRVFIVQFGPALSLGPANTGYVSFNDSTSAYCQACVFIADDFQIHMVSEFRTFLEALGYTYPGASDYEVMSDILGHEMFHNWQNNYVKPTASGRSVPGSYSEGTARFQESLHDYSHASHQPGSLLYANDANGCNGVSASDTGVAGGAFQAPSYSACNFWLPWYGTVGIETLAKLVMEGAPSGAGAGGTSANKVINAIQAATGRPYAESAAVWAAGLITGKNMTWGPPGGSGEALDWGLYLRRWVPGTLEPGDSATVTLANGGVMARRVYFSHRATITDGAVLAVLRASDSGTSLTYPSQGQEIPGPAAGEAVYLIGINPGVDQLQTTIGIEATEPVPPPPDPVTTTLYMDGAAPIGEADGLGYQTLLPESSGSEKSMQLVHYVAGPNTACAGNYLFPVFIGDVSGKITGDLRVTFDVVATGGAVDIRIWPDVGGQLCNETYPAPGRAVRVDLPSGPGSVDAVLSGADLSVGSTLMVQITPVTASPWAGRMFYGTPDARVSFECIPARDAEDCLP